MLNYWNLIRLHQLLETQYFKMACPFTKSCSLEYEADIFFGPWIFLSLSPPPFYAQAGLVSLFCTFQNPSLVFHEHHLVAVQQNRKSFRLLACKYRKHAQQSCYSSPLHGNGNWVVHQLDDLHASNSTSKSVIEALSATFTICLMSNLLVKCPWKME